MKKAIVSGLLSIVLVAEADAQTGRRDPDDVRLRNDCRLAHQVLTTGHPHPHWRWAMETIDSCGENGGEALASVWAAAPADTVEIARLVSASRRLRDTRVVDAVLEVAGSEAAARLVRLGALQVLVSYVDPALYPRLRDFEPVAESYQRPTIRRALHVVTFDGSQPPDTATAQRVLDHLRSLAETAVDARVRYAADYLYSGLRRLVEVR